MAISEKARFSPANPGPVAVSFANYVADNLVDEYPGLADLTPEIAQAFFSFHGEWQSWRNAPGGEAEAEKRAAKLAKAAGDATKLAKKLADARELIALAEAAEADVAETA